MLLAVWVLLTGALHLDGVADCADAWVGGFGDREKTFQILKDPRSGPIAVVVLVLVLLVKWAALEVLLGSEALVDYLVDSVAGSRRHAVYFLAPRLCSVPAVWVLGSGGGAFTPAHTDQSVICGCQSRCLSLHRAVGYSPAVCCCGFILLFYLWWKRA